MIGTIVGLRPQNLCNFGRPATVRFVALVAAAAWFVAGPPASAQDRIKRAAAPLDLSIVRTIDPRLQHAVQVMASESRLEEVVRLDRDAALLSGKYTRRIRPEAHRDRMSAPSAAEIRQLASQAGAAERRLYQAMGQARSGLADALGTKQAVSLIQPLNLGCVEAARLLRLRTGSMATEIPTLRDAAVCRGDVVTDRLIYRYCRAATAEDEIETTRALRDIQIQLACMSTRQVRIFESALVGAVERAEAAVAPAGKTVRPAALSAALQGRRNRAVREAFRQLFAPVVFATADASRLFRKNEKPAQLWLAANKDMLARNALKNGTIVNRVGLLFANRFTGELRHMRAQCPANAEKLFDDGRGGRICNPLGALYEAALLPCDATQWVADRGAGASGFICDPACSGRPGSGMERMALGSRSLLDRLGALRPPGSRLATPVTGVCGYNGPQAGGAGTGSGSPGGGGSPSQGGAGGSCGADPMYGIIGQQSPAQAYNAAFTACIVSLARGPMSGAGGPAMSGFAPAGGKDCMIASGGGEGQPPGTKPPETTPPTDGTQQEDSNLQWAKEAVKKIIEGFASFINALLFEEAISAEAVDNAKTAVDNATFGDAGMCPGGPCEGETSADGKTITINKDYCQNHLDCFNVLLHEAMHTAFTGGSFDNVELEHMVIGTHAGDISHWFEVWKDTRGPGMCMQDEPSCTGGCTSLEAAMPDCARIALDAYTGRLREMKQDAKDCATDACWNPADDGTTRGQNCGTPDRCRGQSVALCLDGNPDCMCRNNDRNLGATIGAALRGQLWNSYCARANDERCGLPGGAPGSFVDSTAPPPPGPRPPATPVAGRITFAGGKVTMSPDGTVALGRPAIAAGGSDPDCTAPTCRASQRGDW